MFLRSRLILNFFNKFVQHDNVSKFLQNGRKLCSVSEPYKVDLKLKNTSLSQYINHLTQEYIDRCNNKSNFKENARISELQAVMNLVSEHQKISENIHNLKDLLNSNDKEMSNLALEEKAQFQNELAKLEITLLEKLLNCSDNEGSYESIILEVQAGVGGQEAMLFAKEIFKMYSGFCEIKGWNYEVADLADSDQGGLRHASILINDPSAFNYLKYEAGVHRVQRVPATEKTGRVHTSTASVIVLPQPSEIEVTIEDKDLRIETKRAQGAGGQHVNKTESAVRITHIPTNTSVECQVDRSQIKNRKFAMAKLRAILYEKEINQQIAQTQESRKSQVKTRNRNEKIRTYNFSQDRITDHRLQGQNFHNLEIFMEGGEALEKLILQIDNQLKIENLLEIVNKVK